LIVQSYDTGVINVPAPILSRCFQELSRGVVNAENVRKIAEVPFPFPYTQMSIVMLLVASVLTPVLASITSSTSWEAAFLAFMPVMTFWCLNYMAAEIEQPFGEDANDLPIPEMVQHMNRSLAGLIRPETRVIPRFEFLPDEHPSTGHQVKTQTCREIGKFSCQRDGPDGRFARDFMKKKRSRSKDRHGSRLPTHLRPQRQNTRSSTAPPDCALKVEAPPPPPDAPVNFLYLGMEAGSRPQSRARTMNDSLDQQLSGGRSLRELLRESQVQASQAELRARSRASSTSELTTQAPSQPPGQSSPDLDIEPAALGARGGEPPSEDGDNLLTLDPAAAEQGGRSAQAPEQRASGDAPGQPPECYSPTSRPTSPLANMPRQRSESRLVNAEVWPEGGGLRGDMKDNALGRWFFRAKPPPTPPGGLWAAPRRPSTPGTGEQVDTRLPAPAANVLQAAHTALEPS